MQIPVLNQGRRLASSDNDGTMKLTPEQVGKEDGRYSPAAYRFVYEGLGYTLKKLNQVGHVSGQVLCQGLLAMALERWGRLSLLVLKTWGIHDTRDFG